jgi:beta-phosphoglucomutase-like phosphatase (HAD superfamily)
MLSTFKLPRNAHAVVFDRDGLIFNTEALYRDAIVATAAAGGNDIPAPFYLSTLGMSGEATRMASGTGTAFRTESRFHHVG